MDQKNEPISIENETNRSYVVRRACERSSKTSERHNDVMSLMQLQYETKLLCEQAMQIAKKYNCEYYIFDNNEMMDSIWTEWRDANQQLLTRKKDMALMKDEVMYICKFDKSIFF